MTLPTDLVYAPVSKARLDTPVIPPAPTVQDKSTLPTGIKLEDGDVDKLNFVSDEIERLWASAKNPILLVRLDSASRGFSADLTIHVTGRRLRYSLRSGASCP